MKKAINPTANEISRILVTQLQTLTDNDNAYDDVNNTSISFDDVHHFLEYPPVEFSAEEGYYTAETEESEDCDHGPCIGYNFDNGWIMWTYPEKPRLISFHPNHIKGIENG